MLIIPRGVERRTLFSLPWIDAWWNHRRRLIYFICSKEITPHTTKSANNTMPVDDSVKGKNTVHCNIFIVTATTKEKGKEEHKYCSFFYSERIDICSTIAWYIIRGYRRATINMSFLVTLDTKTQQSIGDNELVQQPRDFTCTCYMQYPQMNISGCLRKCAFKRLQNATINRQQANSRNIICTLRLCQNPSRHNIAN